MRFLRLFLLPLSLLYSLITSIRNSLYDLSLLKSYTPDVPMVIIGNLRVGGTGKTPHTEFLIEKFINSKRIVTLSRGYGRRSKGFILAGEETRVIEIGDEPFQYLKKYESRISVTVGEDRKKALKKIQQMLPDTDVILLDDAFQHRPVRADLNILLTAYEQPFYKDFPLPAGLLRESRAGARRADIVVVTKCPDAEFPVEKMEKSIKRYTGHETPVFFTRYHYEPPVNLNGLSFPVSEKIVVLTGIANPAPFIGYLRKEHMIRRHFRFPDHYWYREGEIREIVEAVLDESPGTALVTTEKDLMRMNTPRLRKLLDKIPVFYIPVKVQFVRDEEKFITLVEEVIQKKKDF